MWRAECQPPWRAALFVGVLVLLVGLAPSVRASDGVIEIDQARVNALGGFPFLITTSGSYILTSNLTVLDNHSAIAVLTGVHNVTLDLNGFTISGAGLNNGIQLYDNVNVEIRNGTLRHFSLGAQVATANALHVRFIDVRILDNALAGLFLGNSNEAEVRGCTVADNGTAGIAVGQNSLIIGNRITRNGTYGIVIGAGSAYGGNLITGNGNTVYGGVEISTNVCDGNTVCP